MIGNDETNSDGKDMKALRISGWIGGVVFILFGLSCIATNIFLFIISAIFGIVLLPPLAVVVIDKYSKWAYAAIAVVLFVPVFLLSNQHFYNDFLRERHDIIERMEEAYDEGDYEEVIDEAEDYLRYDDSKINRLYRKAVKANKRQGEIEKDFSAWNGRHVELTKYVKKYMFNPGSFEHIETKYADMGDYLIIEMTFRGENRLGAKAINTIRAKVSLDGDIIDIINQKIY